MEAYMNKVMRALGHKCRECRFYDKKHCSNPKWRGPKEYEILYGDRKYTEPKTDACVLYEGADEFEEEDT